jgi:hypothetical protein
MEAARKESSEWPIKVPPEKNKAAGAPTETICGV